MSIVRAPVASAQALAIPWRESSTSKALTWLRSCDQVVVAVVVLLLMSHFLDVSTTAVALAHNGSEMNPLSAWFLSSYGIMGLIAEKVGVIAISVVNIAKLPRRWAVVAGMLACIITLSAAASNLHALH